MNEAESKNLEVFKARENEPGDVFERRLGHLKIPEGWQFLPRGDVYLTRTVKKLGPTWVLLKFNSRRRVMQACGLYAPKLNIEKANAMAEETCERRASQRVAGAKARARKEENYREGFKKAVREFLNFAPQHAELAMKIASNVAEHACVVGSGRVARTQKIDLLEKVRLATIAYIRHQHTNYENRLNYIQYRQDGILTDDEYQLTKQAAFDEAQDFLNRHRE